MCVGIHQLHHRRGLRQVPKGKTEDDQRRRFVVGDDYFGIRKLRRPFEDLSQQIQRNRGRETFFSQTGRSLPVSGEIRHRTNYWWEIGEFGDGFSEFQSWVLFIWKSKSKSGEPEEFQYNRWRWIWGKFEEFQYEWSP